MSVIGSACSRMFRAASLVVTDRRWAVALSAMALGFGLFIGVAIGPNAAGTLAVGTPQILELPSSSGGASDAGGGEEAAPAGPVAAAPNAETEASPLPVLPSSPPLAPEPSEPTPAPREPAPAAEPTEEPEEPEGQVFTGTVLHSNPAAGSYALALADGELVSVHAPKPPAVGAKVSLPVEQLANGTFAEAGDRKLAGKAAKATLRGAVTYVDATPASPAYTLSGRGVSVLVHLRPDPAAAPQLPPIGSYATVEVGIERLKAAASEAAAAVVEPVAAAAAPSPPALPSSSCAPDPAVLAKPPVGPGSALWQRAIEVEGEPSTYLDLTGTISAVCPDTAQILFSADDARESGQDLLLAVPPSIKTAKLRVGDSFLATATVEESGALTLAGLAGDEGLKGADDPKTAQGDLKR